MVRGPATALIVVALIAIICGSIALVLDVALIATGAVGRLEEMNDGPISEYTKITIRSVWGYRVGDCFLICVVWCNSNAKS